MKTYENLAEEIDTYLENTSDEELMAALEESGVEFIEMKRELYKSLSAARRLYKTRDPNKIKHHLKMWRRWLDKAMKIEARERRLELCQIEIEKE